MGWGPSLTHGGRKVVLWEPPPEAPVPDDAPAPDEGPLLAGIGAIKIGALQSVSQQDYKSSCRGLESLTYLFYAISISPTHDFSTKTEMFSTNQVP